MATPSPRPGHEVPPEEGAPSPHPADAVESGLREGGTPAAHIEGMTHDVRHDEALLQVLHEANDHGVDLDTVARLHTHDPQAENLRYEQSVDQVHAEVGQSLPEQPVIDSPAPETVEALPPSPVHAPANPEQIRAQAVALLRAGQRTEAANMIDDLGESIGNEDLRQIAFGILEGAPSEDAIPLLTAVDVRQATPVSEAAQPEGGEGEAGAIEVAPPVASARAARRNRFKDSLTTASAGIPLHLLKDGYDWTQEHLVQPTFRGYRKHRDASRIVRNTDATVRTGVGGAVGFEVASAVGNLPLLQAAAGSLSPLGLAPLGLSVVPLAGITGWRAWRASGERRTTTGDYWARLTDWNATCGLDAGAFDAQLKADVQRPTGELVNTLVEEELIACLHTRMWAIRGEIPIMHSAEHYAQYVLPELVQLCRAASVDLANLRRSAPTLTEAQRLQLVALNPGANVADPGEQDKWKKLREVSAAYGKFLAKWHQQRTEGQVTGALAGTAIGLGMTIGPAAPLVCGATWLGRKWWLKQKYSDTDMELAHDGKLECNLDPAHFDAGGKSLFSEGRFIEDAPANREKWLESKSIKYWYDQIQIPQEAKSKRGSKKSAKHLGINAARVVQMALTRVDRPNTMPTDREKERLKETYENLRDERKRLLGEQSKLDEEIAKQTAASKRIEAQLVRLRGDKSDYGRTRRDELELSKGEAEDAKDQAEIRKNSNATELTTGGLSPTAVNAARQAMDDAEKGTPQGRYTHEQVGANDDISKAFAIRVVEAYGPLSENATSRKLKKYIGPKLAAGVGVLLDNTQEIVVGGVALGTAGAVVTGGALLAGQSAPVIGSIVGGLSIAKCAIGGGVVGMSIGSGYMLVKKLAAAPFNMAKKLVTAAAPAEKKEEKKP